MRGVDKRFGLWTAVSMVVGIVIGSGVFFKAPKVLTASGGSVSVALAAWVIGAISMIFGALVFADCASKVEKANGLVDYAEAFVSEKFSVLVGWFFAVLYYPALAAVLAWVAGLYTSILVGNKSILWPAAVLYALLAAALNYFSPVLSARFQVSTTIIKLVPLVLISVVGIALGVYSGTTFENFSVAATMIDESTQGFSKAVLATAFAYEGWVVAVSINNEIKDSEKNLRKALVFGALFIFAIYVTYFLGIVGILPVAEVLSNGEGAVAEAASVVFGPLGSSILTAFVVVSCLGTLNGLTIGASRGFFGLAVRGYGPRPEQFAKVDERTQISNSSARLSFVLIGLYLLVWYGNFEGWFGTFVDISELPIALMYALYMVIYVQYMVKSTEETVVKRFVIPVIALLGGAIVVFGGLTKASVILDLSISIAVFASGLLFTTKRSTNNESQTVPELKLSRN